MFRLPRPFSSLTERQLAAKLASDAGDFFTRLALDGNMLVWLKLELGDREGAYQHLRAVEVPLMQSQQHVTMGMWRYALARVYTDSAEPSDWALAEQIVAPLIEAAASSPLFCAFARGILSRVALHRGRPDLAEEQAHLAMAALPLAPALFPPVVATQIRALLGLDRLREVTAVAEQLLSIIKDLGGTGVFEVEFRMAASEAFAADGNHERACAELRETVRQIQLRADDAVAPSWKQSYLNRNRGCSRAQQFARDRGLEWLFW